MKKTSLPLKTVLVLFTVICLFFGLNEALTAFVENSNYVLTGQEFSSPEEAMNAWEEFERKEKNKSLDICPPYEIKYVLNLESNSLVIFSFCSNFDNLDSQSYAVKELNKNEEGLYTFGDGLFPFPLNEWSGDNYIDNYSANIKTSQGEKSITVLYLSANSEKDIYIDNKKAEKIPVIIDGHECYICWALSRRETFLTRGHRIEIR